MSFSLIFFKNNIFNHTTRIEPYFVDKIILMTCFLIFLDETLLQIVLNIFTDEVLSQFIERAPELESSLEKVQDKMVLEPANQKIFEYLASAILYQQITGKAAASVEKRLLNLIDEYHPDYILAQSIDSLRSCGLSRQKATYMHTLSEAFREGGSLHAYSSPASLNKIPNEEAVKLISSVKGIGSWTVKVMLLFNLGRLDILVENDLGVQKGIEIMYQLPTTPKPKEIKQLTKHWGDLASVGSFLAWRILHLQRGDE